MLAFFDEADLLFLRGGGRPLIKDRLYCITATNQTATNQTATKSSNDNIESKMEHRKGDISFELDVFSPSIGQKRL